MSRLLSPALAFFLLLLLGLFGPNAAALEDRPAKELFGAASGPAAVREGAPRVVGGHARGCLAGAAALPMDGPGWQVMRPSRNRNFGHPRLLAVIERLAAEEGLAVLGWREVPTDDAMLGATAEEAAATAMRLKHLDYSQWRARHLNFVTGPSGELPEEGPGCADRSRWNSRGGASTACPTRTGIGCYGINRQSGRCAGP